MVAGSQPTSSHPSSQVPWGAPQKYPISREAKALLMFTTSNKVILLSAHPCNKAQRNPSNTLILPFQLSVLQFNSFFFFFFNIYLFACTVSSLGHAGFLWFQRSGLSLAAGTGFSLCWLLWLWSMGCRCVGFSTCRVQAQ